MSGVGKKKNRAPLPSGLARPASLDLVLNPPDVLNRSLMKPVLAISAPPREPCIG